MPTGTVKWFNNAKGFGFILPEGGGSDLFAHYSSIEMEGYRTLKAGQTVDFDIEEGDKGLHASHIRPHIQPGDEQADQAEQSATDASAATTGAPSSESRPTPASSELEEAY